MASEHVPLRPSWDCAACGRPWPCAPAREALAREMDVVQMAGHLWSQLEEAAGEIPGATAGDLFDRFLAWTGPLHP